MGATYTRQSTYTDGDVIQASDTNNEFDQIVNAFAASTGHTHDGTTAEGGPITKLLGNSLTFGTGADTDIAITFDGNTSDGVLTWMEDEDYFQFSDDILISSNEKLQFRDTAIYVNSSTDGQLDVVADGAVSIDAGTDIILDADGADVLLKDGGTTYGSLTNSSGELVIKSGSTPTTAMTFSGANVTFAGTVTIGSAGISEAELEILDGATVTTDELNVLDGITSTVSELNIVDGDTSATSTTVADADRVVYNDAGTMKQVAVTDLDTYFSATSKTLTNKTLTTPVITEIDSGSTITLDATTDIVLDADGGNVIFKDDGTSILDIANNSSDVELTVSTADKNFAIKGTDGSSAITALDIDMALAGKATFSGDVVVTGDLTISGDDLTMGTNTSGHIMVADGTNFNPVAVSGDVTISSAGAVTIANGAVETAMVNANVITGQTAETSLDTSNDTILVHDASASALRKTTLASISSALGGITDVVADTSPQLGGNLDVNGNDIVTTSNANLELAPNGTGKVVVKGNTNQGAITLNCESNSHGQTITAQPHSLGVTNTLTLPAGANQEIVGTLDTQDVLNKNLITADSHAGKYGSSSSPITFTVTVASKSGHPYQGDGSGNAYVINGVQAPALTLHGVDNVTSDSGYYYRFDQSDSSNGGHPLRFYLDADKTTEYTTGVTTNGTPGSSGAYTQIDVDEDTPSILYYQCTNHAYMGNYAIVLGSNKINHTEALISFPTTTGTLVGTGDTGSVTNGMLAGSIADSKLSTISTAGKVALSALEIDGGTDVGADLVDADLIIVDDGAGGNNEKSELTRVKKYIYSAMSGDATASDAGALTIANDAVESGMLNDNVISGQTELASGLATTDELLVSDAGTIKRMDVSVLTAVTDDSATALAIALG